MTEMTISTLSTETPSVNEEREAAIVSPVLVSPNHFKLESILSAAVDFLLESQFICLLVFPTFPSDDNCSPFSALLPAATGVLGGNVSCPQWHNWILMLFFDPYYDPNN
jgi:hypothetical protein